MQQKTENWFKTRGDAVEKLKRREEALFHATIEKLLFVAEHGTPDVLLTISFLATQLKEPYTKGWKKLDLHLMLQCKDLEKASWYINGSYATHSDMRGQSGNENFA